VNLARLKRIGLRIVIYVPLCIWAALVLMPLFFLYNNSLKTSEQVFLSPWSLPTDLQWTNFAQLFDSGGDATSFATYLENSFIVTIASLVAVGVIASMAAYALARFPFPGARFVQVLFILALAMPITALLIPIYTLMNGLQLLSSYLGIVAVYTGLWLPFSILLLRAFYDSMPRELEDAARVDGCSDLGVFIRIVLPISKGGLASVTIVNAVGIWSELLFAFILLSDPNMQTINVGLLAFKTQYQVQWNLLFAAMALSVTPLLLLYALFQRQITKGMTLGAFR
jgi:ABC-type glycerol-3-phosphate transport system permease component